MKGKIIWFNKFKKYGFIEGQDKRSYFVHISGLTDRENPPKDNQLVEFSTEATERGLKAVDVKIVLE